VSLNPTNFIQTGTHEQMKMHIVYDGSNRMWKVYEARYNAKNGEGCLVTEYQYSGATTQVTGMKETETTWDSSWDF
jgi:hypothetical protein